MLGIYKPPIQSGTEFLQKPSSVFAFNYPRYEDIIIIGHFNMTVEIT